MVVKEMNLRGGLAAQVTLQESFKRSKLNDKCVTSVAFVPQ